MAGNCAATPAATPFSTKAGIPAVIAQSCATCTANRPTASSLSDGAAAPATNAGAIMATVDVVAELAPVES